MLFAALQHASSALSMFSVGRAMIQEHHAEPHQIHNKVYIASACELVLYGEVKWCTIMMLILETGPCIHRYDPLSWEYPSWASINGPAVNILKGALVTSDRIVTVSEVGRISKPESHSILHALIASPELVDFVCM